MGNQQPVNGSGQPSGAGLPQDGAASSQQQQQHQQRNIPSGPYGGGGGGYMQGMGQQQQQQQQQGAPQGYPTMAYPGGGLDDPHNAAAAAAALAHAAAMQRAASDASMTNMDNGGGGGDGMMYGMPQVPHAMMQQQQQQQMYGQQQQQSGVGIGSISDTSLMELTLDDDTVPTVFKWEHGGRQVYITGTFNNWSRQIPMHRSGNDFTYIHNLKRGKHAFKFIVDDEWRFAPDQPTVADIEGRINNFIDVSDFKPYTGDKDFEKEKAAAEYGSVIHKDGDGEIKDGEGETDEAQSSVGGGGATNKPDKDGEVFSHNMPDLDDYTKEPPPLPPHLRHIILNKPPQLQDTAALPVPQHVALNHLYCTAIKDNMMVLGITQRYKTKFVTTVYYSPCSGK